MSEQLNSGKGFLKDKLRDYQVIPPESVWESISSHLGRRSRRSIIIISISAAATLALAITLGINFFGPESVNNESIVTLNEDDSQAPYSESATQPSSPEIEEVDAGQEIADESQTLRRRETLETKVVRALDDVQFAENQRDLPLDQVDEMITTEDLTENKEAEDNPEEAESHDVAKQLYVAEDQEYNLTDELNLDQGEEITSDDMPEFLEDQSRDPRWIVGAALSPLYSFRDAEASAMAGGADFESGVVAYAGGVHVSYRTTSRLAIESGIFYNKMGISIGAPGIQLFNESFDFSPIAQESGRTDVTGVTNSVGNIVAKSGDVYVNNYKLNANNASNAFAPDNTSFDAINANEGIRQHLDYLELPFNLRYTVVDRAIELQLVGGMSTNFLVNNYVTMETSFGVTDIGYLTNIRSVNYSGNAGLGMVYHIREKFSLRLEPRFRYFLNSINDSTLPSTRPYTLGIYTGLNYTF